MDEVQLGGAAGMRQKAWTSRTTKGHKQRPAVDLGGLGCAAVDALSVSTVALSVSTVALSVSTVALSVPTVALSELSLFSI